MKQCEYINGDFNDESLELFKRAREGDLLAYASLFEKHIDFVLNRFKYDSRMEYDDLRQDVFIKTYLKIPKIVDIKVWIVFVRICARGLLRTRAKISTTNARNWYCVHE